MKKNQEIEKNNENKNWGKDGTHFEKTGEKRKKMRKTDKLIKHRETEKNWREEGKRRINTNKFLTKKRETVVWISLVLIPDR